MWKQRMRWWDGLINSMDMSLSKLREIGKPGVLQSLESQRVRHNWATEQQQQGIVSVQVSPEKESQQHVYTHTHTHP